MTNYHYIIASLPIVSRDGAKLDYDSVIGEIKELCDEKDRADIDFVTGAIAGKGLDGEFYRKAKAHRSGFVRNFFSFDLNVRNIKVRYLNSRLGKEVESGTVEGESEDFEYGQQVREILLGGDLVEKEKKLDALYWKYIEDITVFDWFTFDAILSFIVRLSICDRWWKLDEQKGRQMLRELVNQVRNYKNV